MHGRMLALSLSTFLGRRRCNRFQLTELFRDGYYRPTVGTLVLFVVELTWARVPSSHSSYRACSCADPRDVRRPWSRPAWRLLGRGLSTWCSVDSSLCDEAAAVRTATGTWRSRRDAGTCSSVSSACQRRRQRHRCYAIVSRLSTRISRQ